MNGRVFFLGWVVLLIGHWDAMGQSSDRLVFDSRRFGERNTEIFIVNIDGSNLTNLTRDESTDIHPAISPTGLEVAFTASRSGPSDIATIDLTGNGFRFITQSSATDQHPSWSPDGTQIVFESIPLFHDETDEEMGLYVINVDGNNLRFIPHSQQARKPAWSPKGDQIAYEVLGGEIYVMSLDGSDQMNLTNDPAFDAEPTWSPDGQQIAFSSDRDGDVGIFVINADGSDPINLTHLDPGHDFKPAWSPDGRQIAFISTRGDECCQLYKMNADGRQQALIIGNLGTIEKVSWVPGEIATVFQELSWGLMKIRQGR